MAGSEQISVLDKAAQRAFETEREIKKLQSKVTKSRQNIQKGEIYSEEEVHGMVDKLLS